MNRDLPFSEWIGAAYRVDEPQHPRAAALAAWIRRHLGRTR